MSRLLQSDPRMIDVLGVAMGVDIQGFSREEGSDELPPGLSKAAPASPPRSPPATTPSPSASSSKPAPPPAPEPEDVEMTEEDDEEAKLKADALAQKSQGSAHYKERQFPEAAACFERAWELWPKDVTFLTNLSAVYFEQGEYDKCIDTCDKAVEEGRGVRCTRLRFRQLIAHRFTTSSSALTTNSLQRLLVELDLRTLKKETTSLPRNTSKNPSQSTETQQFSGNYRQPRGPSLKPRN
ncbi:hypothetical protein BV22DRAFT_68870 [Leucogyrophana mollusca]|uniref:Uncharacterized protein n=1 Tax=Leucogyrophana mollusca TaxID=85980 RepID=A0ACB8BYD7_9AGAM|nr:hypothetical protein BV22DRAFT_68870 [Leucogyrophana mollusca]